MSGCGSGSGALDASGLPVGRPVTAADLRTKAQARLFFPGSVVLRRLDADQTPTRPGEEPDAAFTGAILRTKATPDELYSWYGHRLTTSGFTSTTYYRASDQSSGMAWQFHRRLQMQVAVFDPVALAAGRGLDSHLGPGEIAYEAVLVGYAPGLPKA